MNNGENRGKRLSNALKRFKCMLIEEAHDILGVSFYELDDLLGLTPTTASRYHQMKRGGHAAAAHQLERDVAKLLKREAHPLVVENKLKFTDGDLRTDGIEGDPRDVLNLRPFDADDLYLSYSDGWPTYWRLKHSALQLSKSHFLIHDLVKTGSHHKWPSLLKMYSWQWGVLWDKGLPWLSRDTFDIPDGEKVESFLPSLSKVKIRERELLSYVDKTSEGRELLERWATAISMNLDDSACEYFWELIMLQGASNEKFARQHEEISKMNQQKSKPKSRKNGSLSDG